MTGVSAGNYRGFGFDKVAKGGGAQEGGFDCTAETSGAEEEGGSFGKEREMAASQESTRVLRIWVKARAGTFTPSQKRSREMSWELPPYAVLLPRRRNGEGRRRKRVEHSSGKKSTSINDWSSGRGGFRLDSGQAPNPS